MGEERRSEIKGGEGALMPFKLEERKSPILLYGCLSVTSTHPCLITCFFSLRPIHPSIVSLITLRNPRRLYHLLYPRIYQIGPHLLLQELLPRCLGLQARLTSMHQGQPFEWVEGRTDMSFR